MSKRRDDHAHQSGPAEGTAARASGTAPSDGRGATRAGASQAKQGFYVRPSSPLAECGIEPPEAAKADTQCVSGDPGLAQPVAAPPVSYEGAPAPEAPLLLNREGTTRHSANDRLWTARAERERQKVASCGRAVAVFTHRRDYCWAKIAVPIKCDSRWCPRCFVAALLENQARMYREVRTWQSVSHVVLTVKNPGPGDLLSAMAAMVRAFSNLRHQKCWSRSVLRGFYSWGLTWTDDAGWHPHFHALVDSQWLRQAHVSNGWNRACEKQGLTSSGLVWIRRVGVLPARRKEAIKELLEGTEGDLGKLVDVLDVPGRKHLYGEAIDAFDGRPRFRPFGGVGKLKRERDGRMLCPKCKRIVVYSEYSRTVVPIEKLDEYRRSCAIPDAHHYDGWFYPNRMDKPPDRVCVVLARVPQRRDFVPVSFRRERGWSASRNREGSSALINTRSGHNSSVNCAVLVVRCERSES